MKEDLKILLIDDDETDRENILRLLNRSKLNVDLDEAQDFQCGIEIIKAQELDCILTDYHLPDAKGIEIIDQIRDLNGAGTAVVVLTGMGSETLAAEVLKKGAADYVSKNGLNADVLERSITNAVQVHRFQQKANTWKWH